MREISKLRGRDSKIEREGERETERQREADRQTDRQTDRQKRRGHLGWNILSFVPELDKTLTHLLPRWSIICCR